MALSSFAPARWRAFARAALAVGLAVCMLHPAAPTQANTVEVAADASLQAAIDAAPEGTVIRLAAGTFRERVVIAKPLTLIGAGWDATVVAPTGAGRSDRDKLAFVARLEAARSDQERQRLLVEFTQAPPLPTISIRGARVTLRDLQVGGPAPADVDHGLHDTALVACDDATVSLHGCAVVGPFMVGVAARSGADVEIRRTLVAGLWNVGVLCDDARKPGTERRSRVRLIDSDVRNCYHRCVAGLGDGSVVERCRISGSAWHGIVYAGAPKVTGSWIFGNARSGIYASGDTSALVRDNVFWRNEMNGISSWFGGRDRIERNTFVGNLREGIAVVAGAKPSLTANVFTDQPVAISCGRASGHDDAGVGAPELSANVFARNDLVLGTGAEARTVAPDSRFEDVRYRDAAEFDFTILAPSGVGAHAPMPLASPWPVQRGEAAIVPDGDTRDWRQWKKPK